MLPRTMTFAWPAAILATPSEIFRVTNSIPRIGTFVVKQDSVAHEHGVGLAVVHAGPVRVDLCDPVRASRMEGSGLVLRLPIYMTEHLARRGLVESCRGRMRPHGLEETQRSQTRNLSRQCWLREGRRDERLGPEVVDLGGIRFLDRLRQRGLIHEVAVDEFDAVQDGSDVRHVGAAQPTDKSVDPVALLYEQPRKKGAILASDSRDEGPTVRH